MVDPVGAVQQFSDFSRFEIDWNRAQQEFAQLTGAPCSSPCLPPVPDCRPAAPDGRSASEAAADCAESPLRSFLSFVVAPDPKRLISIDGQPRWRVEAA